MITNDFSRSKCSFRLNGGPLVHWGSKLAVVNFSDIYAKNGIIASDNHCRWVSRKRFQKILKEPRPGKRQSPFGETTGDRLRRYIGRWTGLTISTTCIEKENRVKVIIKNEQERFDLVKATRAPYGFRNHCREVSEMLEKTEFKPASEEEHSPECQLNRKARKILAPVDKAGSPDSWRWIFDGPLAELLHLLRRVQVAAARPEHRPINTRRQPWRRNMNLHCRIE